MKRFLLVVLLAGMSMLMGGCLGLFKTDHPTGTVTYSVSGVVVDEEGNPLEGVEITFGGGFASVMTNQDGKWSRQNLTGTVVVTPIKDGYVFDPPSRQVSAARTDVDFVALDPLLYYTDFDDPQGYANDWTSESVTASNLAIEDGFLRAPSGSTVTALLYLKPEVVAVPADRYAVETRVRFTDAVGNNVHAGLFAQAEDVMTHTTDLFHATLLDISFHTNNVARFRSKDGSENQKADYGAPDFVPADTAYLLRLEIENGEARYYIDGELVGTLANDRPVGQPGLRIWKVASDAIAEYDFFRVERLP